MVCQVVVISGTPGTGKSTLAEMLAKEQGCSRLILSRHYKDISKGYNKTKQCYDIDLQKFTLLVKEKKNIEGKNKDKKNKIPTRDKNKILIIDSHIAHLLPKKLVDLCIILTCSDLKKLQKRLRQRKYSKQKIRENLDAEIFQVCLNEAKEIGHKVIVFDTAKAGKREILNNVKKSMLHL
ncbi:MAG: AAA family ATPase [Nanoarchaeota archaeon]